MDHDCKPTSSSDGDDDREVRATVLCKSNDSEFRRSSTKFYVNLRNFKENEFSAKFRWPLLFHHSRNFVQMCELNPHLANSLKVAKFVRNFASGSEISNEVSNTLFV